jgi:hypothetical protein
MVYHSLFHQSMPEQAQRCADCGAWETTQWTSELGFRCSACGSRGYPNQEYRKLDCPWAHLHEVK